MKLCTFHHGDATRIGVVTDDGVVDLAAAAPELPNEMTALLTAGPAALRRAASAASNAKSRLALTALRLAAPLGNAAMISVIAASPVHVMIAFAPPSRSASALPN